MKLALVILLAASCIVVNANPDTISQDAVNESGPFTNKVSGSGSSAQTFSQSTTEYTTTDGRTIVSSNSNHQSSTSNGYKFKPKPWILITSTMTLIFYYFLHMI